MNQDQGIIMKYQKKTPNEFFMAAALKEAHKAFNIGEIPVGAVIVHENKIIARGYNKKEKYGNPLLHAEMVTIQKASQKIGDWRLNECSLYVTLEPCPMCAGAIIQSRIKKLFYGTRDLKSGAVDSIIDLLDLPWNHKVEVVSGILVNECQDILKRFFQELRKK